MRIAFLNWNNRRFGGTGSYLSAIMPALHAAGYEVALWHEVDTPAEYPVLPIPSAAPVWSVSSLGLDAAVDQLREWRPDLLYAHGLLEPAVERRALDVAPAVFFAHDYYGTCISGLKAVTRPVVTPCQRTFGWRCLAEYYPRRCGGLSPVTMVRQFTRQLDRLHLLRKYAAIVTHSSYMQQEYVKHGFAATRVFNVKYGADPTELNASCGDVGCIEADVWRLLFAGRMDRLKGGSELLHALPEVSRRLGKRVHLTFAGDGPARASWEAQAQEMCRREPAVQVEFRGWLAPDALDVLYASSNLLALPSVWPEPLALVGLEAGRHKLPTVAFDVGGISDWLRSGVNGVLAPGDPPTVPGLAAAIVTALESPETYQRLRRGAERLSQGFTFDQHLRLLVDVFEEVAQ
jgi:glycosyltransferase involved in cell wall biosynthesis